MPTNSYKKNFHFGYCQSISPLITKSDQHLSSPYNKTPESRIKVTRIKEIITNWRSSRLLNNFSSSAPWEVFIEQYEEDVY